MNQLSNENDIKNIRREYQHETTSETEGVWQVRGTADAGNESGATISIDKQDNQGSLTDNGIRNRKNIHSERGSLLVFKSKENDLSGILQAKNEGHDRLGANGINNQNIRGNEPSSYKRVAVDPELNQIVLDLSEMIE